MIQNPSKYHPNPLSHFLSLHNSATSHLHHTSPHNNQPINHHPLSTSDVTTSLDVGKSFTIAAILGLQKNAIENSQKELNDVMNLSLNNHHLHHQSLHHNNPKGSTALQCNNNSGSNSNSSINNNHSALSVNNFECDNLSAASVVQRYLPAAAAAAAVNGVSCNSQNPFRLNHFGPPVGNGNVNGQSALQSLQQLHQHHAQQVSLGFQQSREKTKSDHISGKKSSLKSKRVRTIFTPEQLERLEAEFERQQYMVGPERLYLAHTLQLTEAQVKVWFQNRRIKWRKHHLEITQQRLAIMRQRQIPAGAGGEDPNNANGAPITNLDKTLTPHLHQSESDLSICNDSLDTESIHEGEDG